ncbi:hypothetical protein A1D23_04725 [Chelonobacter oris]|uniref:YdgA family protein n=1 Tax=Chelonobacter oris TaxID=505317 RepID=UPI002447EC44|nr:YdgA family protein [Chelonobacter oris]MDH2999407.1 hypothetical protein [Chelonobacter oris]
MKKSGLAIGIVGVLVVAWAGGTWYTGKALEEKYAAQIEALNNEIRLYLPPTSEITLEFANVGYQRGFFSTEIQDKVVLRDKNGEHDVRFDSTVQHGPLPLSNLVKLNLKPVMATGQSRLAKNALVEQWFAVSKGQNPFISDFSIGYNDTVVAKTRIAAIEYSEDNREFKSSEVVIDSNTNLRGIGDLTLNLDHVLFQESANGENVPNTTKIQFDGISLHSAQQTSQWQDLSTGMQTWTVKNIDFDLQPGEPGEEKPLKVNINDFVIAGDVKLNGDLFDILSKIQWQKLNIGGSDFGKFQFNFNLNKLDGNALNELVTQFKAMPANGEFTPEQNDKAEEAVMALLKKQPELQVLPLSFTNSAGASRLNLDLGLNFADESSENLLDYLSKFELNGEINKKMLQQLIEQVNGVVDEPKDPQQVYQEIVQQLIESDSFVETPDAFTAKLILENGQLKHNGEVVPPEKVDEFIVTMMMAAAFYQLDDGDYDLDYADDDVDFDEANGEFSPNESFDLAIPDLSPSDLEGLPPAAPQQ